MSEVEQELIEPGEELLGYIGKNAQYVVNDLIDKEIPFRLHNKGTIWLETQEVNLNRLNLVINEDFCVDLITRG